jgi:hypothetical protein
VNKKLEKLFGSKVLKAYFTFILTYQIYLKKKRLKLKYKNKSELFGLSKRKIK